MQCIFSNLFHSATYTLVKIQVHITFLKKELKVKRLFQIVVLCMHDTTKSSARFMIITHLFYTGETVLYRRYKVKS